MADRIFPRLAFVVFGMGGMGDVSNQLSAKNVGNIISLEWKMKNSTLWVFFRFIRYESNIGEFRSAFFLLMYAPFPFHNSMYELKLWTILKSKKYS